MSPPSSGTRSGHHRRSSSLAALALVLLAAHPNVSSAVPTGLANPATTTLALPPVVYNGDAVRPIIPDVPEFKRATFRRDLETNQHQKQRRVKRQAVDSSAVASSTEVVEVSSTS
ncbi:hypothetical protein QFC21_006883 [Naganishia friedmannii]|uniref:Uncharacterized protein n=1 Tax=Naganishia friedmannii TaxID=89922 RepID=A0ACC2V100_9TREE|nr:hypothetical protein QFC21_006883 [Naganishia friedmannii]